MTQEEFNMALKILKRFLKEHGRYKYIMSYLFPAGRSKNDLLSAINCKGSIPVEFRIPFCEIFLFTSTLGPSFLKYGRKHWDEHIKEISEEWYSYCIKNHFEYLNYI